MVRFKPTNYDSSSHRSADSSSDAAIRLRLRHHGLSLLDLQHDGGIAHRMLAHFGHAEAARLVRSSARPAAPPAPQPTG
jgi:hypothetical protein